MAGNSKFCMEIENKIYCNIINTFVLWPFQFQQEKKTNSGYKHFHFILDVSYVAAYTLFTNGCQPETRARPNMESRRFGIKICFRRFSAPMDFFHLKRNWEYRFPKGLQT